MPKRWNALPAIGIVVLVLTGCDATNGAETHASDQKSACTLFTSATAAAAMGLPASRLTGDKSICAYVAPSSISSHVSEGVTLMVFYGQPDVGAYTALFHRTAPIVTRPGTPSDIVTFTTVRVHGLDAFWQKDGGTLTAIDKSYVLRISVQGSSSGESIAEKALQGIQQRVA
jgi:hypothetical protein